jgi:hypothetical protein
MLRRAKRCRSAGFQSILPLISEAEKASFMRVEDRIAIGIGRYIQ